MNFHAQWLKRSGLALQGREANEATRYKAKAVGFKAKVKILALRPRPNIPAQGCAFWGLENPKSIFNPKISPKGETGQKLELAILYAKIINIGLDFKLNEI